MQYTNKFLIMYSDQIFDTFLNYMWIDAIQKNTNYLLYYFIYRVII